MGSTCPIRISSLATRTRCTVCAASPRGSRSARRSGRRSATRCTAFCKRAGAGGDCRYSVIYSVRHDMPYRDRQRVRDDIDRHQPGPAGRFLPRRRAVVDFHRPYPGQLGRAVQLAQFCAVRCDRSVRAARRLRRRNGVWPKHGPAWLGVRGGGRAAPGLGAVCGAHFPVRRVRRPGLVFGNDARPLRLSGGDPYRRAGGGALPRDAGGVAAGLSAGLPQHPADVHRAARRCSRW